MARGFTQTVCPQCQAENAEGAEACFRCGRALFALVHGSVLAERYEILRPLGHGGMGRVYQAHDRILDERVAVKVLRPELSRDRELAARFRSEIKLARRVTHRNVCRIHEYGEDGALRFISMEYVEGMNLRQYTRGRGVGTEEAFEISLQMGRGLQAVHELGILHRDFKAANIMIDARGVVKLMDFGIARELEGEKERITTTGQVMGTPEYMSPEQARGAQIDLRSDIYALGCVVFEVFTGRGVFQGDSAATTLYKHLHEAPPLDTPGLPGPLLPLLGRALAKSPAERPADVGELLAALDEARTAAGFREPGSRSVLLPLPVPPRIEGPEPSPVSARPPRASPTRDTPLSSPTRALSPRAPAVPWMEAAAAVAVVVLSLGLGYAFWKRPREAPPASPPGAPATPLLTSSPSPTATVPAVREESAAPVGPTPRPLLRSSSVPLIRPESSPPPPTALPVGVPLAAPVESPTPMPTATPDPATPAATGILSLLVVPPAEVTVDEGGLGLISSREIALAPGRHVLRIEHPEYEPLRRVVRIRAGQTERVVLDLAEKAIRKGP